MEVAIDSSAEQAVKHHRPLVHIGVLALQGDYAKHLEILSKIESVQARLVRVPDEIDQCDGLIIPGGESTTLAKLMKRYGVDEAITRRSREGMPVFGTCAGLILLARDIEDSDQPRLGLMDITVRRNAFGRQVDSFETPIHIEGLCSEAVKGIFIRAPFVTAVGGDAEVMAALDTGEIVMVRQGNCLAAAFHPELTSDTRVHAYFADMVSASAKDAERKTARV